MPEAGIRASLTETYWPSSESWPLAAKFAALPNIWKPSFLLTYTLAFVVLERAARPERRTWSTVLTLAALTGFLGLTSPTLTPIVLFLWVGLEAVHLVQCSRAGSPLRSVLIRSACGLALAALLLLTGGFSTVISGDSATSGLALGWIEDVRDWRLLGVLERLPGGIALLGVGPLAVAGVAALVAWRDRLVLALTMGALMLMIAALVLRYDPAPQDLGRLAGRARNFALFALLLALGGGLAKLRTRWRYAAGAVLVSLVVWPTVATPINNLRLAIGSGVELANVRPASQIDGGPSEGRYQLRSLPDRIAAFIRNNTAVDARVFSPRPHEMTYATGRPNASGFDGLVHLRRREGPAYRDVLLFLEPAAVRRLGFEYVHATDEWVEGLPRKAVERLNDPNLFELLVRDGSESLYGVLPAFDAIDVAPAPGSYELLRQSVPASATVLVPERFAFSNLFHTAWALSHARLQGVVDPTTLHLQSPWWMEPVADEVPDLIVTPLGALTPAARQRIWWNEDTAVYALSGAVDPIMPPPTLAEPLQFSVRLSDVSEAEGRIAFTVTFDDRAPDRWTSQDWVLITTDTPPWNPSSQVRPDGSTAFEMWFGSYLNPGRGTSFFEYEFDFHAPSLAIRREHGAFNPLKRSEGVLDAHSYVLAVRLRHHLKPEYWRDAAIIPVLRITVSETGEVSYDVHEEVVGKAISDR